jgi:hypothetical protein
MEAVNLYEIFWIKEEKICGLKIFLKNGIFHPRRSVCSNSINPK